MPIRKVGKHKWKWGVHGHVYNSRAGAERQAAAAHAHGYEGHCKIHTADDHECDATGAGCILQAPSGKMLFLKRSQDASDYAGHWALPGGHREVYEQCGDTAVRETAEETGHRIDDDLGEAVHEHNGFVTYAADCDDEFTPSLNSEHTEHCWAYPHEAPEPLHPGVARTLDELGPWVEEHDTHDDPEGHYEPWEDGDEEDEEEWEDEDWDDEEWEDADEPMDEGEGDGEEEEGLDCEDTTDALSNVISFLDAARRRAPAKDPKRARVEAALERVANEMHGHHDRTMKGLHRLVSELMKSGGNPESGSGTSRTRTRSRTSSGTRRTTTRRASTRSGRSTSTRSRSTTTRSARSSSSRTRKPASTRSTTRRRKPKTATRAALAPAVKRATSARGTGKTTAQKLPAPKAARAPAAPQPPQARRPPPARAPTAAPAPQRPPEAVPPPPSVAPPRTPWERASNRLAQSRAGSFLGSLFGNTGTQRPAPTHSATPASRSEPAMRPVQPVAHPEPTIRRSQPPIPIPRATPRRTGKPATPGAPLTPESMQRIVNARFGPLPAETTEGRFDQFLLAHPEIGQAMQALYEHEARKRQAISEMRAHPAPTHEEILRDLRRKNRETEAQERRIEREQRELNREADRGIRNLFAGIARKVKLLPPDPNQDLPDLYEKWRAHALNARFSAPPIAHGDTADPYPWERWLAPTPEVRSRAF